MYKVLIAEDEVLTRAGIVSTVNWSDLDMQIAAQAGDGIQALTLFRSIQPDVVVTDLNMPRMDGVELIAKIHEEKPSCKIIVVTCIDDVQTIKRLFPYHIADFLLKSSISAPDLQQRLLSIKQELDQMDLPDQRPENAMTPSQMLHLFLEDANAPLSFPIHPCCWMFQLHVRHGNKALLAKTILNLIQEYFASYSEVAVECKNDQNFLVCFENTELSKETILKRIQAFQKYAYRALNQNILCNLEYCDNPSEMKKRWGAYFEIIRHVRVLDIGVYENQTQYFTNRALDIFHLYEFNIFSAEVRTVYEETVLNPLRACLKEIPLSFPQYQQTAADCLSHFSFTLSLFSRESLETYMQELMTETTFEGVYLRFQEILASKSSVLCIPVGGHEEMLASLRYIQEHCGEKLTLNTMAESASFSPNYFSSIFKKGMGVSFINYLINFRISRAMELLKNESLYLYEVAEQVGIPDVSHFSKTFKTITGYSPNSWRKMLFHYETGESEF